MIPHLSIIIAAYNEEDRLPETLKKIHDYVTARDLEAEIIVVDDGSTDGTAAAIRALAGSTPGLRLIGYPETGARATPCVLESRTLG